MASTFFLENTNKIPQTKKLRPGGEWLLPLLGSKPRSIRSIHIAAEDDHVFLADYENFSIIELSEHEEMLIEFRFDDQSNENDVFFKPWDVCSISPGILVACGRETSRLDGKVVYFERKEFPPFLRLKKIITTKETPFYSLCSKNESIFCCDCFCKIHSFSKEGEKMKTIEIDGLTGSFGFYSRIRVDPSSREFWGLRSDSSKIISFNSEGKTLGSVKKRGTAFFDFSFDKFGQLYFSTDEGIFSFFPKIKLLYKFPEKSEYVPTISVSKNRMIVWIKNRGKDVNKVFKIIY